MSYIDNLYENCLLAWLNNNDQNGYRQLIDAGEDFAVWLKTNFPSYKTPKHKIKVIDLMKELRFPETQGLLLREALNSDPKVWQAALEGLAYQGLENLRVVLEKFKQRPEVAANSEKCACISEILNRELTLKKPSGRRLTLVCFALKEEAAKFKKLAAGDKGVAIRIAGIGRRNAERSARDYLAAHSPDLVLTCGFAGGLNPGLKVGDVIFETPDENLRAKLGTSGAKAGKFHCADRIAITASEKKKLRDETGADAVEMESAAVHAVCRQQGIPCATLRVISDTAQEDLPLDFNALARPDKSLHFRKLLLAVAKSPRKISALLALQKKTKLAAEELAAVLAKLI